MPPGKRGGTRRLVLIARGADRRLIMQMLITKMLISRLLELITLILFLKMSERIHSAPSYKQYDKHLLLYVFGCDRVPIVDRIICAQCRSLIGFLECAEAVCRSLIWFFVCRGCVPIVDRILSV